MSTTQYTKQAEQRRRSKRYEQNESSRCERRHGRVLLPLADRGSLFGHSAS